jgi:hypothetical protein
MAEEMLVESQIADSVSLVKALDADHENPSYAAWNYFADDERWRLLIAGPTFDALLPQHQFQASRKLVDAFHKAELSSLGIGEISLVRTDDPLVRASRVLHGTAPDAIVRAHFRNNNINGVFIKEMLVLRSS